MSLRMQLELRWNLCYAAIESGLNDEMSEQWPNLGRHVRKHRRTLLALLGSLGVVIFLAWWLSPFEPANKVPDSTRTYLGKSARYWISQLDHEDWSNRVLAVRALGSIGPEAKDAVPKLLEGTRKMRWYGGMEGGEGAFLPPYFVALALRTVDPAAEHLVATLPEGIPSPWQAEQFAALQAEEAGLKNGELRLRAYETLAKLGIWDRSIQISIGELANALDHGNEETRSLAMGHVFVILRSRESRQLIPAVGRVLRTAREHNSRSTAAKILGAFAPDDLIPTHDVIEALKDPVSYVREDAVRTLGKIGLAAVPGLREALNHSDPSFRAEATHSLAAIGAAAKDAVLGLQRLIMDEELAVRRGAAIALWKVARESTNLVPILSGDLKHKEYQIRLQAVRILAEVGSEAKDAVPALLEILQEKGTGFAAEAAKTLGDIGPAAKRATPILIEVMLRDDREEDPASWGRLPFEATKALQKIEPDLVVPTLLKLSNHSDPRLQERAYRTLLVVAPEAAVKPKSRR